MIVNGFILVSVNSSRVDCLVETWGGLVSGLVLGLVFGCYEFACTMSVVIVTLLTFAGDTLTGLLYFKLYT